MSDPENEIQGPRMPLPPHPECRCSNPERGSCECDDDGSEVTVPHQNDHHNAHGFPRITRRS